MARLCPQCGEIHFDTPTEAPLTHCRKCEANLNEVAGLLPQLGAEPVVAPGPSVRPDGVKGIVIGAVLFLVAGLMLYIGFDWRTRAKEVTANVYEGAGAAQAPSWAKRDRIYATYFVGQREYYQYPGVRKKGDTFPVYYLPEDPATGYEQKPFLMVLFGGMVQLVSFVVLAFGLMRFFVSRIRAADLNRTMARAA